MARTISHLRENKEDLTAEQYTRLRDMLRLVNEAVVQMIVVVSGRRKDLSLADSLSIENDINELRNQIKSETVVGVNSHQYSYTLGTLYNDIVADCEKIGDYVMNIVEARLGKHLLSYHGLSLNLDKLMDTIWAGVIVTDRTINVNITRLRKKLGAYAQNIVSRTGYGYVFEEQDNQKP